MSPCFIINARNERVVLIVQVLKDELRHKILLESEHLFLQRGYDRTSLQMIADKVNISKNLTIYPRQNDVVPFYNRASLVLNLTNKKQAVETFGLTALEAMSAGLPVIVPTEGGIAELVEDGVNGYKIDVQNLNSIAECIDQMLSNRELYTKLSDNALRYATKYNADAMINGILSHF